MTPTDFVFYSHIASVKGHELAANPKAALLFHWKSLRRQVRIRGNVTQVSEAEADAYFATRPKQAQIGAWASKQSQPLESRFAFEQAIAAGRGQAHRRRGAAAVGLERLARRACAVRILARPAVPPA